MSLSTVIVSINAARARLFHGEKAPPLATNVVIAVGNWGLYTGPWGGESRTRWS